VTFESVLGYFVDTSVKFLQNYVPKFIKKSRLIFDQAVHKNTDGRFGIVWKTNYVFLRSSASKRDREREKKLSAQEQTENSNMEIQYAKHFETCLFPVRPR